MSSFKEVDPPTYEEAQLQSQENNHPQDGARLLHEAPPPLPRRTPTRRRPPLPERRPVEEEAEDTSTEVQSDQNFWKFHIQCFGDDMYLSTNPTMRHLQCRSLPGYFMSVDKEETGFTINFEEFESGNSIMRFKKLEDGSFKYKVRRTRKIEGGEIVLSDETSPVFEGTIDPRRIDPQYYPIQPPFQMKSFEVQAIDGRRWDVGAIPRVKMKWSLSKRSEYPKYVGKQNIYFHRNFKTKNLHMQEEEFPPVTALFRPCESKIRKRAMQSINRLSRLDEESKISPQMAQVDPFAEQKSYFKCGDGLYEENFPKDDDPDHHFKLGWVTVFEDKDLFNKSGMFDLVVGATTTLAYDQEVQKRWKKL
ncbi:hypothetical protein FT663_01669 [Candidozyma haemuli var. vulneris]|uniref:Uncharacterized protein n=1 Tax=Candidozyma haemuli TaxID=45357 RepID=A0A2V1AP43_9ASCO|nr:hypothetical protein CXQ85_001806 [[Candida] haemuloni]KAF3990594.1 hypothetical protein FT662_02155 [[Candida] haemuloni var. vulneris]KAF3993959.1 hypothetical protein FT663_01669 [[Candida] haemuloni var. vulneris]PVH20027.1 hypothetical protein CXQ85_001806 [[Candida] haemuloni]